MSKSITIVGTTISGNTATAQHSDDTIVFEELDEASGHSGGVNFTMGDGSVIFHLDGSTDDPADFTDGAPVAEAEAAGEEVSFNYIEADWVC